MHIDAIKYNIETSKEGLPTLSIIDNTGKNKYLHSKYYPSKERDALKDQFIPDKFDTVIVLGIGLGYHLVPLKNIHRKYKKIILIDAVKNIEYEIEKNQETGFLTQFNEIVFLSGMPINDITPILEELIELDKTKGLSIIDHPHSLRAFSEYYKNIRKIIERIITRKAGNKATIKAFGMLYLRNIIKNLPRLQDLHPVMSFFNKMNGYPALVITSGPSLERYLDTIYNNQHRFFIISVDSSAPALLSRNIMPDFIISIDPQPFIYEHLVNVKLYNIITIFTLSSHPLLFNNNSSLLSLNSHPLSQLINNLFPKRIGSIDSHTGTVAGDAFNCSFLFGFKATGLIGFDFSFPDYKIYSRGTSYQKRFSLYFQNRLTPVETLNLNYIMKSSKGVKYNNLYTRRSFINYKNSLEEYIAVNNNKNLFNIFASGIPIKGVENIALDSFLTNFCHENINKRKKIDKIFSNSKIIGEKIYSTRLKEVLDNSNLLEDILQASVDDDRSIAKTEAIKSMLASISFSGY